jgi:hypothetical protein
MAANTMVGKETAMPLPPFYPFAEGKGVAHGGEASSEVANLVLHVLVPHDDRRMSSARGQVVLVHANLVISLTPVRMP